MDKPLLLLRPLLPLFFLLLNFFATAQTPDAGGIVYVNINVSGGNGSGNSWANATTNLQAAINANGVSKVFVATGNYPSPTNGFVMKNNVEIYGGFNPSAGITTLAHNRIMPTETIEGTILDGEDDRRIINNDNNGLNSSAVLDGITISNGTARTMIGMGDTGGGIFNYYSSPTLRNLVVKLCYAATAGGGIANINSSSVISNTLFLSNGSGKGAAVYSQNSNTVINYTVFKSNAASQDYGSAIYTSGGTTTLTNSLMAENYYNSWVVSAESANTTLNNVTIVGQFNSSLVMWTRSGTITTNNSIIIGGIRYGDGNYTPQNTFTKDFSGYENADIDINDIFTNLSAGDYSLKPHPAVTDKGNNALFPNLDANTKDLAGNPRVIGSAIDLGAYEYIVVPDANGIVYVTPNGTGNGSSWSNATNSLQKAIDAAGAQQVYVAVGNYNVGTASFIMKNGVKIYGGFDPENNNTSFANRIKPTETTDGSVLNGLNTRPVIWNDNNGLTNTAVLDGFTITGGYTNQPNAGAGITNKGVSPTFNNLVIRDNVGKTALNSGGMLNYQSSAVVSNTLFINNKADNYAGAVFNHSTGQSSYTNVIFKGNQAPGGAAMFNYANNPVLTNVLISGNKGDNIIDVSEITGSGITMINTTVANNVNMSNQPYASILNEGGGVITVRNSIIFAPIIGSNVSQNSFVDGNTNTANGNVNTTGIGIADVFTNPSAGDFSLKHPAVINKGSNALFSGLDANSKDLAGNPRLVGATIDLGAYEYTKNTIPDANGIIYVKSTATGSGDGTSWNDATADLHNAIHAPGVQKVFVATGNYNVGSSSFVMKNGVAIYGGFNPGGGITDLSHNRILPTESTAGSVLNGENNRPLIWNNDNGLNNTAILDGFTLTNGNGTSGGAIFNASVAPVFNNLVIKNNTATTSGGAIYNVNSPIKLSNTIITGNTAQYGGGVRNNSSNSEFTNVTIKNNTATLATAGAGGGGIFNENSALKLTNVLIANNSTAFQGGGFRNLSGNPILTNVTIVNNIANDYFAIDIATGTPQINNSIILGRVSGNYIPKYSMIVGNADFSSGNIPEFALNNVFTNPAGADYTLKIGSPAVNAGSNALFAGLTADTKDLAGKARVYKYGNGGIIDLGAYESVYSQVVSDANGIAYVKADGTGNGSDWNNATSDLHIAIQTPGVTKVFVAKGSYNVGDNSFVMKNGVEIYGGFDPSAGITDLTHDRIMPNAANTNGSILNGEGARPVIWNVFTSGTAMNNTAILDGFTVINGSYSNGAGIRNVYASPTLRNLVIRGNTSTGTGAGIYNENSNPDIYNTVISGNMVIAPFGQSGMGAGIYNGANAAPTIVNTTIVNNTITGIGATPTMIGAGVANLSSAAPKIYNSIIWNNQKNGVANIAGADIENISASVTLKNSITQLYTTGNAGDNNKVGSNPLFAGVDFKLQSNSPAVNTGNNSLYTFSGAFDLAGNARTFGSAIDIGAYEYKIVPDANGIVYVKTDGTGSGTTWADATNDLHSAITSGATKVYVATGNYPVGSTSFTMKNGVEIYGGFNPLGNTTDWNTRTLPSLTVGGSVLDGQDVNRVIYNNFTSATALNATAVLDGFTITGGNTTFGAGMYNVYASPTLANLVIKGNKATTSGGGIAIEYASPTLTNVVISGNILTSSGTGRGGGMYNYMGDPTLTNVIISNNTATAASAIFGGGVYNYAGSPKLINVSITDNTASASNTTVGGAMYNTTNASPTLINVTITGNKITGSYVAGGGIQNTSSTLSIYNSIFWANQQGGSATVANADMQSTNGGTITLKNSITQSYTTGNAADNNLVGIDPMFASANNFSLQAGSPAINVGDNNWFTGLDANTKDLAGNSRVASFGTGGIIDMGAYESPFEALAPDANGIIYVKTPYSGTASGKDWDNATSDLHNAIHTAGVQKVFVAKGNYNTGDHSFIMKNGVEIYGGFDPANNIKTLADNRIMPNPANTNGSVLNGENARPVIWNVFTSGTEMDNTAVLDGFTVMNGNNPQSSGGRGAGMSNKYASPTLRNLVIRNNEAYLRGGGISNEFYSSPLLTNVVLQGNKAMDGGGLQNYYYSHPILNNVDVINNIGDYGGGIYIDYRSSINYTKGKVQGNSDYLSGKGAGIANDNYSSEDTTYLTDVSIIGNTCNTGEGGGIYNQGNLVAKRVIIKNNTAKYDGGGIYNNNEDLLSLEQVLIANNTSTNDYGGGIYTQNWASSSYNFTNTTIVNNLPDAFYSYNTGPQPVVNNSIIMGDVQGTTFTAQNSLINAIGITATTLFTNPTTGDYTLKENSPAVEGGNNALFSGLLDANTKDLAGNRRLSGPAIDMGVYEYQHSIAPDVNGIVYVRTTALGKQDGSSWNDAIANLQGAINAVGAQKVFVATGNYNVPSPNSFVMKNGVAIYGGFDPDNNIRTLADNRILPTETISGSVLNGKNERNVIWNVASSSSPMNNTAVLDGFTITNGLATGATDGGGIHNDYYASPTMRSLVVKGNNSQNYGGGICNRYSSNAVFTNVVIMGNTTAYNGAGISNYASNPVLTNVKIINNTITRTAPGGTTFGGGMYNNSSNPIIINTLIAGNTITATQQAAYGGGMYNTSANPVLTNVTVANNTVSGIAVGGAGIYNANSSELSVYNSILWGNSNGGSTNGADIGNISPKVIKNSVTQTYYTGNAADNNLVGIDPMFVSSIDFSLQSSSQAINAGDNDWFADLDANTKDLAGNARIYNFANSGIIDLGAYEYQGEATLPVTLISFTAKADGNRAKLQWETASESNNKGFEIYRAESGKQKAESSESLTFIKIGEVSALVTHNSQLVTYNFTDNSPLNGNNYYKLVQLDNDGKATDLGIRTVNFGLPTSDIRLFPNPTADIATATFAPGIYSQLQVTDLNGRVLQRMAISPTENSKAVSLGVYPIGTYMITLSGKGTIENRKIVKR